MAKRQDIRGQEEWIKKQLKLRSPRAMYAWDKTIEYFAMHDYLDGGNRCSIINYLYKEERCAWETINRTASKNFIGERTLYRYRKEYVLCFSRYYTE